jgi:hypothetical protein
MLLIAACIGDDSAGDAAISEASVNNEMPSERPAIVSQQVTAASLLNCEAP